MTVHIDSGQFVFTGRRPSILARSNFQWAFHPFCIQTPFWRFIWGSVWYYQFFEKFFRILIRWISFFTFSDFVKSDMDSTWYFCRLINCESQIHLVTHWADGFKSEIISRNLSIGNVGDALLFSTKNYQKTTGRSLITDGPWPTRVWRPPERSRPYQEISSVQILFWNSRRLFLLSKIHVRCSTAAYQCELQKPVIFKRTC